MRKEGVVWVSLSTRTRHRNEDKESLNTKRVKLDHIPNDETMEFHDSGDTYDDDDDYLNNSVDSTTSASSSSSAQSGISLDSIPSVAASSIGDEIDISLLQCYEEQDLLTFEDMPDDEIEPEVEAGVEPPVEPVYPPADEEEIKSYEDERAHLIDRHLLVNMDDDEPEVLEEDDINSNPPHRSVYSSLLDRPLFDTVHPKDLRTSSLREVLLELDNYQAEFNLSDASCRNMHDIFKRHLFHNFPSLYQARKLLASELDDPYAYPVCPNGCTIIETNFSEMSPADFKKKQCTVCDAFFAKENGDAIKVRKQYKLSANGPRFGRRD